MKFKTNFSYQQNYIERHSRSKRVHLLSTQQTFVKSISFFFLFVLFPNVYTKAFFVSREDEYSVSKWRFEERCATESKQVLHNNNNTTLEVRSEDVK